MIKKRIKNVQRLMSKPANITTTKMIAVSVLVLNVCQLNAMDQIIEAIK
jgi:hypothetical protein